jgi:hypothetical protein
MEAVKDMQPYMGPLFGIGFLVLAAGCAVGVSNEKVAATDSEIIVQPAK